MGTWLERGGGDCSDRHSPYSTAQEAGQTGWYREGGSSSGPAGGAWGEGEGGTNEGEGALGGGWEGQTYGKSWCLNQEQQMGDACS